MKVALLVGLLLTVAQATNVCPDGAVSCPDGDTCCLLSSGDYGCCPLPKAVCCSDHLHCCPQGSTCDVSKGTCTQGDSVVPFLTKIAAVPEPLDTVGGMLCPNSSSVCDAGTTCCMMTDKKWGCCPLPNAVCCSDKLHCCANGQKCDVTKGTCTSGVKSTPWVTKVEAKQLESIPWFTKTPSIPNSLSVQCDATHDCPSGNTCCKLASGEWGCCPFPNADCCSDGIHCCQSGYTCDMATKSCNKSPSGDSVSWMEKAVASKFTVVGAVKCDSTSNQSCPARNTCCKLKTGGWGCCPLVKAVCCSDEEHCCPQDTTCDVAAGKCNPQVEHVPWTTKTLAMTVDSSTVECKDKTVCPSGSTCCELTSGQYGCCPLLAAVCCSDKLHCCPSGYTCDTGTGACTK